MQRCARIVIRMQSRRSEDEPARATRGHGFQRRVAQRVDRRRIFKQHVVTDRAHASAIELVEQVRVPLPAPGPAAFTA